MFTVQKSLIGAAIAAISMNASALTISPIGSDGGETLVNTILGTGVTITPGSINYVGATGQAGLFSGGLASGLGIDSGIVLTTGLASDAVGPNSSDSTSVDSGTPGDADLQAIVGGSLYNANVLEFQFETMGGDLFFNYVFASEEYNEYVDSQYNDVFAFLVDGVNIAKIGTDEVSINTVNCGNPFGTGGPNCDKFVNNEIDGGSPHNIEYDGFTVRLTAAVTGLSAGVHTMKIVIADRTDEEYDSAVFIEARSFGGEPTDPPPAEEVPEPATLGMFALGLVALGLNRRRRVQA